MINKAYSPAGKSCRVTFTLPPEIGARQAHLCGEFNDWQQDSQPMRRRRDGSFTCTLSLKPGRAYRFRYLLDADRWENDPQADRYVPNAFGSEDSVIDL